MESVKILNETGNHRRNGCMERRTVQHMLTYDQHHAGEWTEGCGRKIVVGLQKIKKVKINYKNEEEEEVLLDRVKVAYHGSDLASLGTPIFGRQWWRIFSRRVRSQNRTFEKSEMTRVPRPLSFFLGKRPHSLLFGKGENCLLLQTLTAMFRNNVVWSFGQVYPMFMQFPVWNESNVSLGGGNWRLVREVEIHTTLHFFRNSRSLSKTIQVHQLWNMAPSNCWQSWNPFHSLWDLPLVFFFFLLP